MAKKFNLEEYATVEERRAQYQEDFPDYCVESNLLQYSEEGKVVIKASIYKTREDRANGVVHASGIAEESLEGFVNTTSRVENCETSALGRALANAGYQAKKGESKPRPSREEMEKVERIQSARKEKGTPSIKEEAPFEVTDDIEGKIRSFTDSTDLVVFFNKELNSRTGEERDAFRDTYRPLVTKLMAELASKA